MFELKFAILMMLVGACVSFVGLFLYLLIVEQMEIREEEKRRLYERAQRIAKRRLGEL